MMMTMMMKEGKERIDVDDGGVLFPFIKDRIKIGGWGLQM